MKIQIWDELVTIFDDLDTLMPEEIAQLGNGHTEEELAVMSAEERELYGAC